MFNSVPIGFWQQASSGPFNPLSIPNCVLWLDPSDASTITLNYNSTGVAGSGLSGGNTLLTTGDLTSILQTGSYIRIGATDTYIVATVSSVNLTTTTNFINTYSPSATVYQGCISQINDKSANGNNYVQGIASNQPAYISQGFNSLNNITCFTGNTNAQYFSPSSGSSPLTGATAATGFFVSKNTTETVTYGCPLSHWGTSGLGSHWPYGSTALYSDFASTSRYAITSFPAGMTLAANLYTVVSSPTNWILNYANTNNLYNAGSNTVDINSTNFVGDPGIGWFGNLGDFVIYSRALTTSEQTQLYNYEKAKWGTM